MDNKFREGLIESGGFNIHYLQWGNNDGPIVMLHSMGMDAHSFDLFSNEICEEKKILAIDLLNHGDSEKPARPIGLKEHAEIIRGVYRNIGFSPCILVGHSVGGMIGMILAAEHPEDLKSLVLVDIAPFVSTRKPRPTPEYFMDESEARAYIIERYPTFTSEAIENRVKYAFKRLPNGRLTLKSTRGPSSKEPREDLWDYISRIKTPTFLMWTEKSTIVTYEKVERMRSLIPDFTEVKVEGSTHTIPQDKPKEFERIMREYLANF